MDKFKVDKTDLFKKLVKKLLKRYKNIENDIDDFLDNVSAVEHLGNSLGKNLYKARIKNSDIKKGKSGGYRLISYLQIKENTLTLIYIYSKSDVDNINEKELDKIVLKSLSH